MMTSGQSFTLSTFVVVVVVVAAVVVFAVVAVGLLFELVCLRVQRIFIPLTNTCQTEACSGLTAGEGGEDDNSHRTVFISLSIYLSLSISLVLSLYLSLSISLFLSLTLSLSLARSLSYFLCLSQSLPVSLSLTTGMPTFISLPPHPPPLPSLYIFLFLPLSLSLFPSSLPLFFALFLFALGFTKHYHSCTTECRMSTVYLESVVSTPFPPPTPPPSKQKGKK